jgi:iron-sulfur cluster repair protein YtfE (RIC family)
MPTTERTPASPRSSPAAAIDPNWSVNELLRRHPATVRVLNARGIDSCCGGSSSLADAARDGQLDLAALLDALGSVAGSSAA